MGELSILLGGETFLNRMPMTLLKEEKMAPGMVAHV